MNELGRILFKAMSTPQTYDAIQTILTAEKIQYDGKLTPQFNTVLKSKMVHGEGLATAIFSTTSSFLKNYDFIVVAMVGDFIVKSIIMDDPSTANEFDSLIFTVFNQKSHKGD